MQVTKIIKNPLHIFSFSCLIRAPSAGRNLKTPSKQLSHEKHPIVPIVLAGQQIFPLPIGSMYAIYIYMG